MAKVVKKRGLYPIIATLTVKSNELNLKIPVRAKLIKFREFACKKCGSSYSYTHAQDKINGWCTISNLGTKDILALRGCIDHTTKKVTNCPYCVLNKNIPNKCVEEEKTLIKLYVPTPHAKYKFINIINILKHYSILAWKQNHVRFSTHVFNGCVAYCENTQQMDGAFINPVQTKRETITIEYPDKEVTMKTLKKAHELYEQRKVEKAI